MSIYNNFLNICTVGANYSRSAGQAMLPIVAPIRDATLRIGSAVLTPVRDAGLLALSRVSTPILAAGHSVAVRAGTALVNPILDNINQLRLENRLDVMAGQVASCADSIRNLTSTLQETVKSGAYLVTALAGAYLYDLAIKRQGVADPFCKAQQFIGMSMTVVAGASLLYNVASRFVEGSRLAAAAKDWFVNLRAPQPVAPLVVHTPPMSEFQASLVIMAGHQAILQAMPVANNAGVERRGPEPSVVLGDPD